MPRTYQTNLEDAAVLNLTDDVSRRIDRIREAAADAARAQRTREQLERDRGDR
ncbi:hypothetical protein [Streptomyces roseolus]|uniref:hypothetical protein n=1 Tax=Streptomyces roseolus TaxID=67358 RepID=UPI00378B4123